MSVYIQKRNDRCEILVSALSTLVDFGHDGAGANALRWLYVDQKKKHNTTELLLFRNVVLMDFRWALKYEQVLAVSRSLYNEFLLNRVKVFSVRFDVAHFQNGWFTMTMARLAETPETL